jgi:hypothetical protein
MADVVEHTMGSSFYYPVTDLDLLEMTDLNAREIAVKFINKILRKR